MHLLLQARQLGVLQLKKTLGLGKLALKRTYTVLKRGGLSGRGLARGR
jgi:hypothetical protein